MGMFDHVRCRFPFSPDFPERELQSKDTPAQNLDVYEIREDGSLWHEDYELLATNPSDSADPVELALDGGSMTRSVTGWSHCVDISGPIIFHDLVDGALDEYVATFEKGQLIRFTHLVADSGPSATPGEA